MKKISTILVASLISATAFAQNPVIVNGNFEGGFRTVNATSILPPASISSDVPNGWYCADSLVVGLAMPLSLAGFTNLNFEEQSFEVSDFMTTGNTAVGVKTAKLNDSLQVPGIISNAKMTVDLAQLMQNQNIMDAITYTGGTFVNGKQVDKITLNALLDTNYQEEAVITIIAFGKNPANNNAYEVIGEGALNVAADTAVQDLTVTMNYNDTSNTATDTLVIVVSSSVSPFYTGNPYNYLIVDNIEGSYSEGKVGTVGIQNILTSKDVKVYPVPTNNTLTVTLAEYTAQAAYQIQITNLEGKVVATEMMTAATKEVSVGHLTSGLYHVTLLKNGQQVYQQAVNKL